MAFSSRCSVVSIVSAVLFLLSLLMAFLTGEVIFSVCAIMTVSAAFGAAVIGLVSRLVEGISSQKDRPQAPSVPT